MPSILINLIQFTGNQLYLSNLSKIYAKTEIFCSIFDARILLNSSLFFFFWKKISLLNYIRIIPIIQIMCNNFPISSSGLATNEFSEWFHAHSTTNWTEFTGGGFQQPWSDKHPFCWFKTEFFVALMLAFFSQILSHIVKTVEFIKALQFSPAFSLSSSSPDC